MPVILIYLDESLDLVFTVSERKGRSEGHTAYIYTFCLYPKNITRDLERFEKPYSCIDLTLGHQISPNDLYLVTDVGLYFEDEDTSTRIKELFLDVWGKQYNEKKLKDDEFMKDLWAKARKLIEFFINIISHERVDSVYLLKHTIKVIDYGSVGMDVFFDNVSVPYRIEDILDVKSFIRWAIPNFRAIVDITPDEYKQICVNWIRMAERGTVVDNPLTDPFTESFISDILRSKIYYGWNQDGINEIYIKKEAKVIFVVNDRAYISAVEIQNLANSQRTPIKIEKVRDILKDFYITTELKHLYAEQNGKKESFGRRFWVFDWNKLFKSVPNLENKTVIVDEANIPEAEKVFKRISDTVNNYDNLMDCNFWRNIMFDVLEYAKKYNIMDNEYVKSMVDYLNDNSTLTDCNIPYAIDILRGISQIFKSLSGK